MGEEKTGLVIYVNVEGKRKMGGPGRTRIKYIIDWTEMEDYEMVKRAVGERKRWKLIVFNLRYHYEVTKY